MTPIVCHVNLTLREPGRTRDRLANIAHTQRVGRTILCHDTGTLPVEAEAGIAVDPTLAARVRVRHEVRTARVRTARRRQPRARRCDQLTHAACTTLISRTRDVPGPAPEGIVRPVVTLAHETIRVSGAGDARPITTPTSRQTCLEIRTLR